MFLHRESMDWITGISKAIDYIEEHITEPTDYARAAKIICRRREFTKLGDDYTNREIPEFWNECGRDGSIQKLCGYIKDSAQFKGLLGVCFSTEMTDSGFPYGIGAEYDGESDPQDFEIVEIPAYTYAVFTVRGRMPDAFRGTYRKICTEFFPQSGYEYGNGVEIEAYPSADVQNPDYTCEIWIVVKPKK